MIARHAIAGDPRLRALGLIDTEQSNGLSWRFKCFLAARHVPGLAAGLGWVAGRPRLRRNRLVLGGAFADSSLLDGEFDEFFLRPAAPVGERRDAAIAAAAQLRLPARRRRSPRCTRRIDVPVQLVWGEQDIFFPVEWAREMVGTFPDARLEVIADAGLFSHEERPEAVAAALLQVVGESSS